MVTSKEDFEKFILKHVTQIRNAIISANEEQISALTGQARAKAKKRTISSLMNDLVTHNLEVGLSDTSEITIKHHYNQLVIILSSDYILKCKKSETVKLVLAQPRQCSISCINYHLCCQICQFQQQTSF